MKANYHKQRNFWKVIEDSNNSHSVKRRPVVIKCMDYDVRKGNIIFRRDPWYQHGGVINLMRIGSSDLTAKKMLEVSNFVVEGY